MAFGVYIHIPYCIQRCAYCDFTTFEKNSILPIPDYLKLLSMEIKKNSPFVPYKEINTLYFGGGTPSLLKPNQIEFLLHELQKTGFKFSSKIEITIEINPATLTEDNLSALIAIGINRFSVGIQTFEEEFLKSCGREHSVEDSHRTLEMLEKYQVNYSFDLLFGLPHQTLEHLTCDLEKISKYSPQHLSAYCLTVPENHRMNANRPSDEVQVIMFDLVRESLSNQNLYQYEISNFAKTHFESKHNLLYWTNQPYWGIGLSAHSYWPKNQSGLRFWNTKNLKIYENWVLDLNLESIEMDKFQQPFEKRLLSEHFEILKPNELMTDYVHTHLRLNTGLELNKLQDTFTQNQIAEIFNRLTPMKNEGLLELKNENQYSLTTKGQLISNLVFSRLLF